MYPVYKSGTKEFMENYRPISVITNLPKNFEKCIKKRMFSHLELHNVIAINPYGFKKAIIRLMLYVI